MHFDIDTYGVNDIDCQCICDGATSVTTSDVNGYGTSASLEVKASRVVSVNIVL